MPTQSTYVYNPTTPGLEFTASQTWTIADGIFVGSGSNYGVYDHDSGSKLVNKGHVSSASNYAVVFVGDNNTVINDANADIFGAVGVYMTGENPTVTNHGTVLGETDEGVWADNTSHLDLHNDGEIYGHADGVLVESVLVGATGATIDNAGLIYSDEYGLRVSTNAAEKTTIVNEHGGTIKGVFAAIYAKFGTFSLENHGTIDGSITSTQSGGHDKVVNDGTIKGAVYLGPGNDVYKNAGGKAGKVDGGDGNDTLTGGSHTDKFVFSTTLNPATNVDTVTHFTPGTDEFFLSSGIFTALAGPGTLKGTQFHIGKHAGDSNDYIIYNKHTGALYYDADGNGGGSPKVQFAQLDKHLDLHHNDFIVFA